MAHFEVMVPAVEVLQTASTCTTDYGRFKRMLNTRLLCEALEIVCHSVLQLSSGPYALHLPVFCPLLCL